MNEEEYKDYLKLSGKITEKLDNTATYESWLIIQEYIDRTQQKVEKLEKENKELRNENKRIFQNVNDDELLISNAMNYSELKKAEKKVEQLENIRKEAIEYVKDWQSFPPTNCTTHNELKNLLNILNKGDNNGK